MHEMINSALSLKRDVNHLLNATDICDIDMHRNGRVGCIAGVSFAGLRRVFGACFISICKDNSKSSSLSEGKGCVFSYTARSLHKAVNLVRMWKDETYACHKRNTT
jgi:hypothetical protein